MRSQTAFLIFTLLAAPALAGGDAVDACRAAHAGDADAHIHCLEAALRGVGSESPPVAAEQAAGTLSGLGAEQVLATRRERESAPGPAKVRIVSTTYNGRGLGTFRMADGQVWRETMPAPERRRLKPDTEYDARIVPARISGYRMHVDGVRWMKTVERVE
jgi:hypothetical protein